MTKQAGSLCYLRRAAPLLVAGTRPRVRYPDNGNNTMRAFDAVDFYNLDEPPSAPTHSVSGAIPSSKTERGLTAGLREPWLLAAGAPGTNTS
jgi:hypothetical protein